MQIVLSKSISAQQTLASVNTECDGSGPCARGVPSPVQSTDANIRTYHSTTRAHMGEPTSLTKWKQYDPRARGWFGPGANIIYHCGVAPSWVLASIIMFSDRSSACAGVQQVYNGCRRLCDWSGWLLPQCIQICFDRQIGNHSHRLSRRPNY